MRKPFWKKSHEAWYCEIDRKQIRLGKDKTEAEEEFHRLMADKTPVTIRTTVEALTDQFLVWTKENRDPETYAWYLKHLQPFATFIGPKLRVSEIKPMHVTRWLTKDHQGNGNNYKNGACRAVNRVFNWAKKQGLIQVNPISGMERPAYEPSEAFISREQWQELSKHLLADEPITDFLVFMHETGCRPQEARIATAATFDRKSRQITLSRKNSKGKKSRRVIRLNDLAFDIANRLSLKRPEGPLFLCPANKPWTRRKLCSECDKLEKKVGFRITTYMLRHGFCTDALLRGVDPITVSILMGHKNANMVMTVYNHLAQNNDFLQKKLRQATGEEEVA